MTVPDKYQLLQRVFLRPPRSLLSVPVTVYVEKVYEEGNFAGLGIGT